MKPYSMDLRKSVVEAYENGEGTQAELAETFGVSVAWIEKLLRRWRETGSVAPKPHGGGRRRKISGKKEKRLRAIVDATPDATLEELRVKLRVDGSIMSVFRALKRMGITRKKKVPSLLRTVRSRNPKRTKGLEKKDQGHRSSTVRLSG